MKRIILASKSPRRKEILSYITNDFDIEAADVDETINYDNDLIEEIKSLAAENFFHADYEATLRPVYGPNSDADSLVVEGGQL